MKIADFGIARVGHSSKLTEHGGVVGTIDYVAPEYMLNSQVDWRSDIYAIGILGYEMLTGKSPFRGDSVYATMTKRLKSDAPAPSSLRAEVPPGLDTVIKRALERDPLNRYQSAADMFCELSRLLPDGNLISKGAMLDISQRQSGMFAASSGSYGMDVVEENEEEVYSAIPEEEEEPIEAKAQVPSQGLYQTPPAQEYDTETATVALPGFGQHGTVLADSIFKPAAMPSAEPDDEADAAETIDISSEYHLHPAAVRPSSREEMLPYRDLISRGGSVGGEVTQVIVNSASIDNSRLRRLSQIAEKVEPSLWLEVLTLIVAIMIGVGVGFFFVKLFFPELVGGQAMPAAAAVGVQNNAS